jgi:16S rRNA (uracil1498-N3)-methyltransferase
MVAKPRLYVEAPLAQGQSVAITPEQAHYVSHVLRLPKGAEIIIFDGKSGEWRAELLEAGKKGGTLLCRERTRPFAPPPDLWLLFAPLKKARTDFLVEKAVELGAARLLPVETEFTNAGRIRCERLQAHAAEAAEQCGATYVPGVDDLQPLSHLLAAWPEGRRLYWADETRAGSGPTAFGSGPAAILIGPEGGFSEAERVRLATLAFATAIALGPRILRAETAALAALALWQAAAGDWR